MLHKSAIKYKDIGCKEGFGTEKNLQKGREKK